MQQLQGRPPDESEAEKASNSYLMSLIAIMIGLPLPIINLIATAIFFFGNRKATYFVRWHCTQALLSQGITLLMNGPGIYWTLSILFGNGEMSNSYVAYMITIVFFNVLEFIATIYAATRTRKRFHVEWWLFGPVTHTLVKV